MDIGKQIKKYRNELNLSQDLLAEKIFVSRQTISNWENEKSYPDIKSLVLLSTLFSVTLDTLIKGDLEEMKVKIKEEDMKQFNRDSVIFTVLLLSMMLFIVPLVKFGGYVGAGIWILISIAGIFYALKVEKHKKKFDIQSYKEIVAFSEGKSLNEIEKNQEFGKRPYQKILLSISSGLLTVLIAVIITVIIKFF